VFICSLDCARDKVNQCLKTSAASVANEIFTPQVKIPKKIEFFLLTSVSKLAILSLMRYLAGGQPVRAGVRLTPKGVVSFLEQNLAITFNLTGFGIHVEIPFCSFVNLPAEGLTGIGDFAFLKQ